MPSCALSRRDPPHGKNGFSTNKGFTVIELMMAIAVLAIVTSLALPSYRAIIEKRRVTSGAEQVTAFLSSVKSTAVKQNERLRIFIDDAEGCMGFRALDGLDCDCSLDSPTSSLSTDAADEAGYCYVDSNNDGSIDPGEIMSLQKEDSGRLEALSGLAFFADGSAIADTSEFVFEPIRGFIEVESGRADSMQIQFESGQYALNVWIDRLGRTYVCNPDSEDHTPVPGYDSCVL